MAETKLETAKIVNAALPSMPFWKTKAFIGSALVLVASAAQYFGWAQSITPEGQDKLADLIVALLQGGGAVTALLGRWFQKAAPPLSISGGR